MMVVSSIDKSNLVSSSAKNLYPTCCQRYPPPPPPLPPPKKKKQFSIFIVPITFFKIFKCYSDKIFNPLSVNPTKWSNTIKQFASILPTNCLIVFDHFVGLALKGLNDISDKTIKKNYIILLDPNLSNGFVQCVS